MQKPLAELICECDYDLELYEGYSGRGMYGETTTGVVCDNLTQILKAVIESADIFVSDDGYPLYTNLNLRWDNLGRGYILY